MFIIHLIKMKAILINKN